MSKDQELNTALADAIANIRQGVTAYVFSGQSAAYRTVAVELRKLLLDPNTARSFGASGKKPTLFGLAFGRLDQIDIQSMQLEPAKDGWVNIGPPLYPDPRGTLRRARGLDQRISLRDWLGEHSVRDSKGAIRRTDSALKDIADKEGAHSISGWRGDAAGIALVPADDIEKKTPLKDVEGFRWNVNWEQFVIEAGASLLYTRQKDAGQWTWLFDTGQRPPDVENTDAERLQLQHNQEYC